MKAIFPCLLLSVFAFGCASDKPVATAPSQQEVEWAEKVRQLDERSKAIQKQQDELKQQQVMLQKEKEDREADSREAKAQAWLAQNKQKVEDALTESGRPESQQMLESFGFHGQVLDYLVDDVALDGSTLIVSQLFLWKNNDDTGDIARINVGLDLNNGYSPVGSCIVGTKHLSSSELASLAGSSPVESNAQVQSAAPPEQQSAGKSSWTPSNETVNAAYKAGIGVAATAATAWLVDAIHNSFNGGN